LELYELDVTDPANCASVVTSAESAFGPVSGLVYAAGITRDRPVSLMTNEQWNEVLTVNLSGVFYLTREVAKSMMVEKNGSLIYIGSVSGQLGNAGQVNYSASKAGLIGMAKTLAVELGPYGIRCNVVAPGPIETPMTQAVSFTKVEALRRKIPLRRFGSPLDVSAMVCYLLSDSGCYISGQVITIDGGLLAS